MPEAQDRLENLRRTMEMASRHDRLFLEVLANCLRRERQDVHRQLYVGMSLASARALLTGWTESPPSADASPDKSRLYYTIDFTSPAHLEARALRLTFDNGRLLLWGEPVRHRPATDSRGAAG